MSFGRHRASQVAWPIVIVVVAMSVLVATTPVAALQPLAVYTGYMDTHTSSPTPNQPNPWPFTSPSNYVGSPCSGWPTSTTCWDAAAIRLDNPNNTPITGVHVVANLGGSIYDLWGSLTVPAGGTLVLTETGGQNSTNFDGSDFPPNAYNGGNFADCINDGVIPIVSLTVGGATTSYTDTTQVLNGGGHDGGHCVGSTYVSGRIDESHPWTLVSSPVQGGPTMTSLSPSSGASAGGTQITINGSGFTGVSQVSFGTSPATSLTFVSDSQVTAVAPAGSGTVDVTVTVGSATSPVNQPADQYTYISPPGPPTGLAATAGNGSIHLAWTPPASTGGGPITGYNLYRGNASGTEVLVVSGVSGPTFTDGGLINGTRYFYKVSAVNSVGPGPLSNEASATPATVASAPQNLVAVAGNASVALSWSAPASNGGAAVSSYNVLRSTTSGAETTLSTGVSGTSYTDTTVSNGITYFYEVTAVNSVGPGPVSNEASATPTPAPTVPTAPQNLVAVAGNASVALSWSAPASNGGAAVSSYNVWRSTSSGSEALLSTGVSGTSYTDSTVSNGITYFYKVTAVNSVGPGPLSNEASATPATVASAPQNLVAVAGNASVALSWSAPASNGGAAVSSYNVLRSTTSGAETTLSTGVSGTSYTDTTVSNGITYFYEVTAVNSVGPGAASNEASATPAPTVPGPPQNLTASAGNASVALSWSAPASNGGAAVSSYNVLRSTTSGAETTLSTGVSGTSYTDSTVSNGITYFYKVAAVNSVGPGPLSNEASATPQVPASAAYVRRIASVTAATGGTSITLTVGSPGVVAGHSIVLIALLSSTSSITGALSVSDTAGNLYSVGRDVNDGSAGDRLVVLVAVNVKALAAANQITLKVPSSGEIHASVDEYAGVSGIDTSAGATASSTSFSAGPVTTAQTPEILVGAVGIESGTTPTWAAGWSALPAQAISSDYLGSAYQIVNTNGPFTASGTTRGTWMAAIVALKTSGTGPPPPTVPGAPTNLLASAGNSTVSLTWTAPASNGGAAITGYNVLRSATSGAETLLSAGVAGNSFTDASVTNGSTYFYKVSAVNSVGPGPLSNEASATPATVASAPQNLVAVAGNASVALSWSAPASNGGAAVSSYNVLRSTTSGAETTLSTGVSGTSYTDTTVSNGITYFYEVTAVNSVGPGPVSNEASATPTPAPTVPTAPQNLVAVAGNASVALSWSAPASNGGAAVSSYNVWRSTSSGSEALLSTGVSGTSYTDSTVSNGITYFYKVTAVNSVGPGPLSNEASATPATVASAPQNLVAVAGNASVALSWSAPASNGGAAVSSYNVLRSTTSGAETTLSTGVSGTSYTDTTVSNGITYFYEVTAVNSVGPGPVSNEASATPAPTVPGPPQNLTASAGNASVALSWSAPASNGGAAVSSYNVLRSTTSGAETTLSTGVSGTSYTDSTVSNGITYFYKVAAVNSVGPGPLSNEASATPQVPASAAYVRRIASVTAATGGTSITLTVGSPGVVAGHSIVLIALLSSTSSITGALSVSDTAGNLYSVGRDVNDGSAGDRLVVLVAVNVKALAAANQITLKVPSSGEIHASVDEYAGVSGIDTSAGATASSTSFSAGPVTTAQTPEILVGAVGIESGTTPTWAAGWSALPAQAISSDYLGSAYQIVNTNGPFTASGTTRGTWMAAIVALKTH